MITVLFFGRLRELLACQQLSLTIDDAINVTTLRQLLAAKGTQWQELLSAQHTLVAVNQAMAQEQTAIAPGDEIAFFPPVTGG